MRKFLALFLCLSLAAPAFGQEQGPSCGEMSGNFRDLVMEFVANWRGEAEFCEFKRLTALNAMIAEDMLRDPKRYNERMNFVVGLKNANEEAINFLRYSFQETWFNTNIDEILLREDGRSSTWSRWLLIGAGATGVALLALPFTKKHSTKMLRVVKTGLKHFFQKRTLTFAPTSFGLQADRIAGGREKKSAVTLVSPPLYFGGDEEILDERTYQVFLSELRDDMIAAGSGILGGWGLGQGASLLVRDHLAKSWSETVFGRNAWSRTKPANFASPGMIVGFGVTIVATNAISDLASDALFYRKFKEMRGKASADTEILSSAVPAGRDFQVYSAAERLKNHLTLQNFILTRELSEGFSEAMESRRAQVLGALRYCVEPQESVLKRARQAFENEIQKIVKANERNVKAALRLSADVQAILLKFPHRLTTSLSGMNDKLMMRASWMLDPKTAAGDLWPDIEDEVKATAIECIELPPGMPL